MGKPYSIRYTKSQKAIHEKNCGTCPIYQSAVERNSTSWDYTKCSKLDCYKLDESDYKKNYSKFSKRFRVSKAKEIEAHKENIKLLYEEDGLSIKQIAEIYNINSQDMWKIISKLGLKKKFSLGKWFRNMPKNMKGNSWRDERGLCLTNTTSEAEKENTKLSEVWEMRDIMHNARQGLMGLTSSPLDNVGTLPHHWKNHL